MIIKIGFMGFGMLFHANYDVFIYKHEPWIVIELSDINYNDWNPLLCF